MSDTEPICGMWFNDHPIPGKPSLRCELPKGHTSAHRANYAKTYDLAYWRDNYLAAIEAGKEIIAERDELRAEIELLRAEPPTDGDRKCPRNHDEPLYRALGSGGFLEMPIDFCPACGVQLDDNAPFRAAEPPSASKGNDD
jgi:hypothetical protein